MTDNTFDTNHVRRFSVKMGEDGKTEVLLGGESVGHLIEGINLSLEAGSPVAYVVVQLSGAATRATEFDGLARVAVSESDPGPAAAVFLSAIDAEELENAALNRVDLGSGKHSLTSAMLKQLEEWANGRS